MECPVCYSALKQGIDKNSQTEVDYCPQCKGLWLDKHEMKRLCPFAIEGLTLPAEAEKSSRDCPSCQSRLYEFQYPETFVQVDMCAACGGFWLDSGELKEIDLVRKSQAASRKPEKKKTPPKKTRPVSQYHEHDMSSLDFSLGSKKKKLLAKLVKAVLACIVIAIAFWGYNSYANGWKKDAEHTQNYLKASFSKMPNYPQHQSYVEAIIDNQHERIIQQCRYDKKVKRRRYSGSHSYSYYQTFFNAEKYLQLMEEEIHTQAQEDKKAELVEWMDLQQKKQEKREQREKDKYWYKEALG